MQDDLVAIPAYYTAPMLTLKRGVQMLWLCPDGVVIDIAGSLRHAGCSCANANSLCGGGLEGDSSGVWIACPSCGRMVIISSKSSSITASLEDLR